MSQLCVVYKLYMPPKMVYLSLLKIQCQGIQCQIVCLDRLKIDFVSDIAVDPITDEDWKSLIHLNTLVVVVFWT